MLGHPHRRLSENGYFPQFMRQTQILILKILNTFLRLKSSPSLSACNAQAGLTLQKVSHSQIASCETTGILNVTK